MNKVLYKYILGPDDLTILSLPKGARIVHCGYQKKYAHSPDPFYNLCFWASVDTTKPLVERKFYIVATGEEYSETLLYVGTIVIDNGTVWHIMEEVL